MRVAWATDVHLNFLREPDADAFCAELAGLEPAAVFLTGDIAEAASLAGEVARVAAHARCPVYFVLGNHDFYGSDVAAVRAGARALPGLARYLPALGVVRLTEQCALVGQDGWGDGRLGNGDGSDVLLSDWKAIDDFRRIGAMRDVAARLALLGRLGDQEAAALRPDLAAALATYPRVVVLTHVPPFEGACWHEGALSSRDWLPWFTCDAVGQVLREAALAHPDREIEVFCGHTHSAGEYALRPNLVVHTGAAQYGRPRVTLVEL